ncbi:MAG: flagellar export protein FliJ [Sphaerobacter thermophilus]|uniref:flagellar export protein FliJ n=1 Tax=Sphaerobacter thermophilus TaxID=2057 RepID=UPI00396ECF91
MTPGSAQRKGFRLERVLEHRRRLTEAAEQQLALTIQKRLKVEAALQQIQGARTAVGSYLEERAASGALDLTALAAAEAYDARLRAEASARRRERAEVLVEESAARAELIDRRIDERVLERLKERTLREQREREEAAARQALDEIATLRYARAMSNGADYGR